MILSTDRRPFTAKTARERPILFSAPMVRALLAGRKTQTRRVVKPGRGQTWLSPELLNRSREAEFVPNLGVFKHPQGGPLTCIAPPYGVPGDLLWVREAWSFIGKQGIFDLHQANPSTCRPIYRADGAVADRWWPSIHMPRWASRITLRVTEVRVERLNEISEADALAEGAPCGCFDEDGRFYENPVGPDRGTHCAGFAGVWEHINGPGSWEANPWVWALSFERVMA